MDAASKVLLMIKNCNMKITNERKNLVQIFLDNPTCHFTASDLHDRLKANGFKVGYATIYRNLKLFLTINFISSISLEDGRKKYELVYEKEHSICTTHLICNRCGNVSDLVFKIDNYIVPNIPDTLISNVENIGVQIYGICIECGKSIE